MPRSPMSALSSACLAFACLAFACLTFACLAGATPGFAADPTQERAAAAENAIRDFMTDMLGSSVRVGDKPIHLQPDGDHYAASATLAPGMQATATVREGAAGVWTFDGLRYPNPAHFTIELPARLPGQPDTRVTYDLKAAEQEGAGTIDTTLATASSTTGSLRALDLSVTGNTQTSQNHVGRGTGSTTLRPGANNTVDVLSDSTVADYSLVSSMTTKDVALNLRADADTIETKLEVGGVSREKAPGLIKLAIATIAQDYAARRAAAGSGKPSDGTDARATARATDARATDARAFVQSFDGFATSVLIDQTATRLRGVVNGFTFAVDRVRFGIDGRSPDGTLAVGMELEADGLTLPPLAGEPLAAFIPSKFQIHPVVTGLNTHDLLAVLTEASDPNRPDGAGPPPAFYTLLQSPTLAAEISSMEVDIGPSKLTGAGRVSAPAPGQVAGAFRLAITGFDALADRVKALPQAGQALPALLFAKGIGRTDGDRLVWDISYDGAKLLVNGVDVLALGGGRTR